MQTRRPRLGGILIRKGLISSEELEAAVLYQLRAEAMVDRVSAEGEGASHPPQGMKLGEALVALGICTEREIAEALADQLEVPYVDLRETPPSADAIRLLPISLAHEYHVLPVRLDGDQLLVAAADPNRERLREAIQQATGIPVVVIASASEAQIRELIRQTQAGIDPHAESDEDEMEADEIGTSRGSIQDLLAASEALSPIEVVNQCVSDLVRQGAGDVFFGPAADGVAVQYRFPDGPRTVASLPPELLAGLVTHVKLMSGMDLSGAVRRQEGRSRVRVDGRPVRLHAATVPAGTSEGAVIRVLE
jgi:type II secretory ATPase GspE/PulE/Tfp pilus assembly ATPase PilB-like protein